jgi:hypothetical protein
MSAPLPASPHQIAQLNKNAAAYRQPSPVLPLCASSPGATRRSDKGSGLTETAAIIPSTVVLDGEGATWGDGPGLNRYATVTLFSAFLLFSPVLLFFRANEGASDGAQGPAASRYASHKKKTRVHAPR